MEPYRTPKKPLTAKELTMNNKTKVIAAAVLLAVSFASGLFIGKGQKSTEVVEIKGEERVVFQDKIVTVIKEVKPDGTTTETIKTEDRKEERESSTSQKQVIVKSDLSQWKVGALYPFTFGELDRLGSLTEVQVQASRRMFGPVWVDVVAGRKSIALGASLEF